MKCFQIIEQLQDLIINSSKIPLSNKVVINQEHILNLLDELLRVIPDDMKDAQKIIEDRRSILIEAQQESEIIVKEAHETIDKMINQDEVTRLAREKSDQIMAFAKQTARDL
ncbi:MAG: ATPase, partial [Tepidanaerobacteraceae bacterium]|nr:ATPase [Tepidanaerobacteraceae bacterium]